MSSREYCIEHRLHVVTEHSFLDYYSFIQPVFKWDCFFLFCDMAEYHKWLLCSVLQMNHLNISFLCHLLKTRSTDR